MIFWTNRKPFRQLSQTFFAGIPRKFHWKSQIELQHYHFGEKTPFLILCERRRPVCEQVFSSGCPKNFPSMFQEILSIFAEKTCFRELIPWRRRWLFGQPYRFFFVENQKFFCWCSGIKSWHFFENKLFPSKSSSDR